MKKLPTAAAALLMAAAAVFGSTEAKKAKLSAAETLAAVPAFAQADKPSGQSDDSRQVYYPNCAAARAAGAAPIHFGEPGYRRKLDRDHDGVACE